VANRAELSEALESALQVHRIAKLRAEGVVVVANRAELSETLESALQQIRERVSADVTTTAAAAQAGAVEVVAAAESAEATVESVDGAATRLSAGQDSESEAKKLLQQVKDAGVAGAISYAAWELAFWSFSVPVALFAYFELMGHLPDMANADDQAKLGAEAFAFVNLARLAVPLRIGLALGTTPWVQTNIVERFAQSPEENLALLEAEPESTDGAQR